MKEHDLERTPDSQPQTEARASVAPHVAEVLSLQRSAGNAAVNRLLSRTPQERKLARWTNLGTESWYGGGGWVVRNVTVWAGTKEEWLSVLGNMDDEDEYNANIRGFLEVCNTPSLVGRRAPPRYIGTASDVNYRNTIVRVPNERERLAFLEALYEKGDDLDLWHGGVAEMGGAAMYGADDELSTFIANNQGLYLAKVSRLGQVVSGPGIEAVASQGGRAATMAMIINAGATAHKGVDLVMASRSQAGLAQQQSHSQAMELIRNAGRTIRHALVAHDARVAFQQSVVEGVFDYTWGLIPGGGAIREAGKAILKAGLSRGLREAMADSGPTAQAERINSEFVRTCNRLVNEGLIESADAQHAINGFEAVRR